MTPLALIFDCDGTLADTMPLHWRAWQQVAARHRFQFTEILALLRDEQGLGIDPLAVAEEKEHAYVELMHHVGPIEQVVAIAREHHGRLPLAVASGGTHHVIDSVLLHLGIRDLFSAIVTSEDVVHQKPAPDIFLEAARRLGVAPQFCRAYEDTDLGMIAIRAAGMEAIDVRELLGS
jgi:HAD superfamily hydrolase (TIGR01509 family)